MLINPSTTLVCAILLLCPLFLIANDILQDTVPSDDSNDSTIKNTHMNWFGNGGLNINSQGQFRSSAEIMNIYLGDPSRFYLPFYLTLSASAEVLNQESELNSILISDLMMNKGGFINFGIENENKLFGFEDNLNFNIYYLVGGKSISGPDLESQSQIQYFSFVQSVGLSMSSYAWNPSLPENKGRIWIRTFLSFSKNPIEQIRKLIDPCIDGMLISHHIESGIQLKDYLDITMTYNTFVNNQHIKALANKIFTVSAKMFIK